MKVLVDTSVWSLALRRSNPQKTDVVREFRSLIQEQRVEMLGSIRQEILSGIKTDSQFETLRQHLDSFDDILLEKDDFVTAARFFNICRSKGVQGSNTDFLISAVAVRRQMPVFTTDNDFKLYSKHLPISLHQPRDFQMNTE